MMHNYLLTLHSCKPSISQLLRGECPTCTPRLRLLTSQDATSHGVYLEVIVMMHNYLLTVFSCQRSISQLLHVECPNITPRLHLLTSRDACQVMVFTWKSYQGRTCLLAKTQELRTHDLLPTILRSHLFQPSITLLSACSQRSAM